jgi:hypothetical protein
VRLLHAAARMRQMPTTCHHASFIDTLPLFDQSAGTPVSWELKTCHYPVTSSGNRWQQVASSHVQWHPVTFEWSSGNKCLLVEVRSHFGLRLGGRNNPHRASNRILGRRIKGGGLLPGWVKLPVRVLGGASPPRTPPIICYSI